VPGELVPSALCNLRMTLLAGPALLLGCLLPLALLLLLLLLVVVAAGEAAW
jgi:hypothetical protein